ncbi:deoxyribonuclease V [Thermodesulfobacteriota bacterium]
MGKKISIHLHSWKLSYQEAAGLQKKLAAQVIREDRLETVNTIAGIDVSVKNDLARAAVVVLNYPDLETIDAVTATRRADFPYIPGLLSFREGPVILDALEKLSIIPNLLIFDGQGIAHPRRLGIACHIGLLVDIPAIGCAKTRLCGQYQEPSLERGSHTPLLDGEEIVGTVLRTRSRVKPVFVSIGHRVDLSASINYTLSCCKGFRLPETTRRAHRLSRQ